MTTQTRNDSNDSNDVRRCYLMDPTVCEALGHENPTGRHSVNVAEQFRAAQARLAERIANGTADCACCGIEKVNCACRPGAICCRN
jgi:hypothetical protein